MKYFTQDNTDGFDRAALNKFNEEFPEWAQQKGFDLNDDQHVKSAIDQFHNEVMIYAAGSEK